MSSTLVGFSLDYQKRYLTAGLISMIMVIMIVLMNNLNTRSLCLNRKSSLVYYSESVAFIFCPAKKNSRNVAIYCCNCYNWVELIMKDCSIFLQTLVFSNNYTIFS